MTFDSNWIEKQREALPELPQEKKRRFIEQFELPAYDAEVLTDSKAVAGFFEKVLESYPDAKIVSNWMMGDFMRLLNAAGIEIEQSKIAPESFAAMLKLMDDGTISGKIAKTVFTEMFETGKAPDVIVKEKGLVQITDESAIEAAIDQVLAENPSEVERYKAGKPELIGFFVGQVMKATRGKANPGVVNKLLKEKLG
jgi:aspartyl-tRNA(Asn)/glutamyl-tRNA(Gln) amidotransferase subunit B